MTWNDKYFEKWKQARKHRAYNEYLWTIQLAEEANSRGLKKALDIGCAVGYQSVWLAKQGFNVTGLDISEKALNEAKELAEKENATVTFVNGDAAQMPVPNNEFEMVLCSGVIQYNTTNRIKQIISEIHRVMKPKGIMIMHFPIHSKEFNIDFPNPGKEVEPRTYLKNDGYAKGLHYHLFTKDEVDNLLSDFNIIQKITFTTDKKRKPPGCASSRKKGKRL